MNAHAMRSLARLLPWLLLALTSVAYAHKASDSYLTLARDGAALSGRWDLALRDLDAAIGLDADGNGEITWGELRARHGAIAAYMQERLAVRAGGEACELAVREHEVDRHTDGAYAVLVLQGRCPADAPTLEVTYRAMFDVDPQHRGLLNFVEHGASHSYVFAAESARQTVGGDTGSPLRQVLTYGREGVWHIWLGFDHILFLLSLLLPAVLYRRDGAWHAVSSFKGAFAEVAKVVTAFTVAHSITLSLAALGVVALPSRWVESAIALSVVLAALNNLLPVVSGGRWMAAFAFGLVHGFGFAGALQDLGLPTGSLALSLFGFNAGVEVGQLAIVSVFLPIAFALRTHAGYRRGLLAGGSVAIAAIASVWLVERVFDVPVFAALAFAR